MKKSKPFSAMYYCRENKGRVGICVFMLVLATMIFLAGNFIHSAIYSFHQEFDYSDDLVVVGLMSSDENYHDFWEFVDVVEQDPKLSHVMSSAFGFSGIQHKTVMALEMGGNSYTFNSVEDMEKVFKHWGIEADLSHMKHNSVALSKAFANNRGIKLGDTIDHCFDSALNAAYTVDAIIDDDSYVLFYLYHDDVNLGRIYIYSEDLHGKALYEYVNNLAGDRKVQISTSEREGVEPQFYIFYVLFYTIDFLLAIVLAVTINSVMTGQYLKRVFEFGVYRALGKSKGDVKRKVAGEILLMNLCAVIIGVGCILLFTYLMNELVFIPTGKYLLYFTKIGAIGFVVCDLLILIPVILSKGNMMSKADVTEF